MSKKEEKSEFNSKNIPFMSNARVPPPPPKRKITNMKKSTLFLIVCVICSLIAGIGATVMHVQYFFKFNTWEGPIPGMCCFDPNLWVIIPIAFGVGFIVPAIAWVLFKTG